jgi:HK97 family phage prohead protease
MAETFRPPQGVRDEAKRALKWIADGFAGSGFTDVGRSRASQLARGDGLSAETILRMYSYLSRHEVDKQGSGFNLGDEGYPSAGRVAWAAWGGDAGFTWSAKVREQLSARAALLEGQSMSARDMMQDMMQESVPEAPQGLYGIDTDVIPDAIMAADAAMDAAQDLLEPYEALDPIICQAYYLIKAADAALSNAIAALGLKDEDEEVSMDQMPADMVSEMSMYSANEVAERASSNRVGEGSFVSWDSSGGRARGKVVKVVSKGPATSSDGYTMEATPELPVFQIRIYESKNNGYIPTDKIVVHRADALTLISALPAPRSEEIDMELRKSRMASAERFEMSTEIRAMDSGNGELRIGGYAAQFNKEATGLSFREVIAPGAFKRSLQSGEPVYLLVNHDTNGIPLASTTGGTLNLSEDEVGLRMEADLDPANPKAQELFSAISRGDIAKMSFAFTVNQGGSTREEGLRTLTDVNLFEVSAVTWPAYNDTALGLRTEEDAEREALELRKRLLELKQKFTK